MTKILTPRKFALLDLDGNLYDSHQAWQDSVNRSVPEMIRAGLPATELEALAAMKEIYNKSSFVKLNPMSDLHIKLLAKQFLKPARLSGGEYRRRFRRIYTAGKVAHDQAQNDPEVFKPYDDARGLMESLKDDQTGYVIVTDGLPDSQWNKIHRLRLSDLVGHDQLICSNINRWKSVWAREPRTKGKTTRFYQRVLRELKIDPKRDLVVMVGDRESSDVKPAQKAGITTIRVLRGKYANEALPSSADYVVRNLSEAARVIRALSPPGLRL